MKTPRISIAAAIAALATLIALPLRDVLAPVDYYVYDLGVTARPVQKPADMLIVGIDEAFMEDRHPYLAPRDRLATLVRNLASCKPKAIVLDIFLDARIDKTPNGVDAQLRAALKFARDKKVPVFLSDVPKVRAEFGVKSQTSLTAHGATIPYFSDVAQTGSVMFKPDSDFVVRNYHWSGAGMVPMPILVAEVGGQLRRKEAQRIAETELPITYCGPPSAPGKPGTIEMNSAMDFMVPPEVAVALEPLLKGKLLFVGATFQGSDDYNLSPYSVSQKPPMYGIELLAQTTQDVQNGLPRRPHNTAAAIQFDFSLVAIAALLVALAALQGTALGLSATVILMGLATAAAWTSAYDISAMWGFRFHPISPFLLALPLAAGGGIAWRSIVDGRALRRVKDTFGAYVGSQVLESLGDKMPELGGETRSIAVLFCDIRGYSALAESMNNDPKALLDELNAHFAPLVAALQQRGAYVDNYVGDLVMALFGAPVSTGSYEKDVRAAVLAAMDFVAIIDKRNEARRKLNLFPIEVGIGVHCGEAVVGNLGSTDAEAGGKIHYTAIGDTVNVASRIESATRGQNVPLLVTREVVEACGDGADIPTWERIGEVNVKGRAAAVEIYKVAG